jgi:hypothetical protein
MRLAHIRLILPALLFVLALPIISHAQIGIGVSITVAPPEIPVYVQPELPAVGYMWTPGYWQYGPDGYFWVPGTWVQPPTVGVLWTPGYWGWSNGVYAFNEGYWGPHIGFYGGVNYGFGYGGAGFEGGEWRGGGFFYNSAVVNIGSTVHVTNVYTKTVVVNNTTRVSFNGGSGGTNVRPTPAEQSAAQEHHVPPTAEQTQNVHAASSNHALLASVNHGAPAVAATAKPGVFTGKGVVAASHAAPAAKSEATASHEPAAKPAAKPAASHEAVAHPAAPKESAPEEKPEAKAPASHPLPKKPTPAPKPKAAPTAKPEESSAAEKPAARPEAKAPAPAPRPAARPAPAPKAPAEKPAEEKRD